MTYDLTLASAGFNTTGKFGQSLNAGKGAVTAGPPAGDVTIEGWFKHGASLPGTQVCINVGAWIGLVSGGFIRGTIGSVDIIGTTNYADDQWHHVALTISPASASNLGSKLYVDGVLQGSGSPSDPTNYDFSIGGFPATGAYDWVGEIDDVALTAGIKYTSAFTPPTAAISNSAAGLIAVWHLDGNGLDTKAADTTAPTVAAAAVANATPTVVSITMTEAMDATNVPAASAFTVGGHTVSSVAISGSQINLTCSAAFVNGEAARTVAYTQPGTANARDLAGNLLANFSGQTITNNVGAVDTTAPTFVTAQVANATPTVIQVTMSEALAASVPPTSAFTASGGRTVTGTSVAGSIVSVTVNTAYASTDTITISYAAPGANPRIQDSAATPNITASFGPSAVTNNVAAAGVTLDTSKMVLSPGNWNVGANSLKAVNAGAYFRTLFTGTACTLQFDMTGVTNPSRFYYKIDNGPLTKATVAASVVLTVPAATSGWADKGGHTLEFIIQERTNFVEIWTNPAVLVSLSGIVLDAGKSLALPGDVRSLKGIVFGDSITEAQVSVASDGTGDATLSYAYHLRNLLGAEIGVVGFGGQGWGNIGGGNSPTFPNAYNKIYSGVTRSFAGLDFIVINQGQNDSGGDVHVPVTAVLNGLLADPTLPSTCKIIVMRPFSGSSDSTIIAGIAACSNPARVSHMDTAGFFNTANSADGVHPYGNEQITHIAPQVAAQIKAILAGGPTLTTRTVTLTLGDTVGAAANLTGLSWTWQDTFNGAVLSSETTGTTNASGVFSVSVSTSLASGGTGNLKILSASNAHFNGPCAVA